MFKALMLHDAGDGKLESRIEELEVARLPEGDVLVDVEYSTLNYKDGMVPQRPGQAGAQLPAHPGCRLRRPGRRERPPRHQGRRPGGAQRLAVSGELHWGAAMPRRPASRATGWSACPRGLSTRQAMAIGTAGYTSMLAVMALERP